MKLSTLAAGQFVFFFFCKWKESTDQYVYKDDSYIELRINFKILAGDTTAVVFRVDVKNTRSLKLKRLVNPFTIT